MFDLDNVGAEITHQHADGRPGDHRGGINDP